MNLLIGPYRALLRRTVAAAALTPDLSADFQNGTYRKDGVDYASWAAMGGSLVGGAAITGGSGLLCDADGEIAQIAYNSTGDVIVVVTYVASGSVDSYHLFKWRDSDNDPYIGAYASGGAFYGQYNFSLQDVSPVSGSSKIATGYSGGNRKTCKNGGTVLSDAGPGIPGLGDATLSIGNDPTNTTRSWDAFIRKIEVYKATLSDAQIQALAQ